MLCWHTPDPRSILTYLKVTDREKSSFHDLEGDVVPMN